MKTEMNQDEFFLFVDAGLRALERIDWYGDTTFVCPGCGKRAEAKRIKLTGTARNKATWLYCPHCGAYSHG